MVENEVTKEVNDVDMTNYQLQSSKIHGFTDKYFIHLAGDP